MRGRGVPLLDLLARNSVAPAPECPIGRCAPLPLVIDAFLVRAAHDTATHNDKSLRARSSIGTWFKISTDGQGHRDTLQFEVTVPPPRTETTSSPSSAGQIPNLWC